METRLGPTKILRILPKWRSRIDIREKVMGIKVSYFLRRREWAATHCSTITNKKVRFLWKMPENDKKRPKKRCSAYFFRWLMSGPLKIPLNTSKKFGFRGSLGGCQDTHYTWASITMQAIPFAIRLKYILRNVMYRPYFDHMKNDIVRSIVVNFILTVFACV